MSTILDTIKKKHIDNGGSLEDLVGANTISEVVAKANLGGGSSDEGNDKDVVFAYFYPDLDANDGRTYKCDKSFKEVADAMDGGKIVLGKWGLNSTYAIGCYAPTPPFKEIIFTTTFVGGTNGKLVITWQNITFSDPDNKYGQPPCVYDESVYSNINYT